MYVYVQKTDHDLRMTVADGDKQKENRIVNRLFVSQLTLHAIKMFVTK